jgi:hypothetical protein
MKCGLCFFVGKSVLDASVWYKPKAPRLIRA